MTDTGGSEDVGGTHPVVGMLPWPDRFEDFHDKVGISLEDFRDRLSGTWLVSYIDEVRGDPADSVLLLGPDPGTGAVRARFDGGARPSVSLAVAASQDAEGA